MIYRVDLSASAADYLRRLDRRTQTRIIDRLDEIAEEPFGRHTKPLAGYPGRRASRVGAYRIIFSVMVEALLVEVSHIGPRGQIYRRL